MWCQVHESEAQDAHHTADWEGVVEEGGSAGADPHSSSALSKALRAHCAQLVGHVLVLLRLCAEACVAQLGCRAAMPRPGDDLHHCMRGLLPVSVPVPSVAHSSSSHSSYSNGGGTGGGGHVQLDPDPMEMVLDAELRQLLQKFSGANFNVKHLSTMPQKRLDGHEGQGQGQIGAFERGDQCLLSALLFLGRVSWLFRTRGRFLTFALEKPMFPTSLHHPHGQGQGQQQGALRRLRSGSGGGRGRHGRRRRRHV